MKSPWIEALTGRLGPPIVTTSSELRFNCFYDDCGDKLDTKFHLYVNPDKDKYFCQRCQRGGSLDYMAKILGIEKPDESLTMWDQLIRHFLFGSPVEAVEEQSHALMPLDFNPIVPGTQAAAYLEQRGISTKKIEYYNLGYGSQDLWRIDKEDRRLYAGKNRIIFPDYDVDSRLVYWVARVYAGERGAKYKNAQVSRDDKVFNLGRLKLRKNVNRVVICEGTISAICAGYDAVATYGKYVTGKQISMLADLGADEYVVALDGDAVGEAVSLATRLWTRRLNTSMVRFAHHEDPASIGTRESRRRILNPFKWHADAAMEVLV